VTRYTIEKLSKFPIKRYILSNCTNCGPFFSRFYWTNTSGILNRYAGHNCTAEDSFNIMSILMSKIRQKTILGVTFVPFLGYFSTNLTFWSCKYKDIQASIVFRKTSRYFTCTIGSTYLYTISRYYIKTTIICPGCKTYIV